MRDEAGATLRNGADAKAPDARCGIPFAEWSALTAEQQKAITARRVLYGKFMKTAYAGAYKGKEKRS